VALHIGTHKTGTTSFQATLASATDSLKRFGVHVFHSQVSDISGWAPELPLLTLRTDLNVPLRCMYPDSTLASMQSAMRHHVSDQMRASERLVVASHEALSFVRTSQEVERLVSILGDRTCNVVVVLREPDSFLRSWKGQLARMGYPTTSPYPDSYMNTDASSWMVDWDSLIRAYEAVLGPQSVTVIDYDLAVRNHGTIVKPLWLACDLPDRLLPSEEAQWLNMST